MEITMAKKYPTISSQIALSSAIMHLRKSMPKTIDANTLKSLDIAPKNESFVINILKFLKIIDESGNPLQENTAGFYGSDEAFRDNIASLVKSSYSPLFELHGEDAWTQPPDKLQAFFRTADSATELTGRRKANTFQNLASMAGKREPDMAADSLPPRTVSTGRTKKKSAKKTDPVKPADNSRVDGKSSTASGSIEMSVKVEINLPSTADHAVYRAIFKSLKEELLDG